MDFEAIKQKLVALESDTAEFRGKFDLGDDGLALKDGQTVELNAVKDFFARIADTDLPDMPLGDAKLTAFVILPPNNKTVVPPDFVRESMNLQKGATVELGLPASGQISVEFGKSAAWEIATGVSVGLKGFEIAYWDGVWSGTVTGALILADIEFDVRLAWPEMTIEGWAEKTPDPKKLAQDHGLPVQAKTPRLDNVRLFASPRAHVYQMEMEVRDLVQLGPLAIDEADLVLDYRGGPKAAFTGTLHTELTFQVGSGQDDTITFELSAEKTEKSWKAAAKARHEGAFGETVEKLSSAITGQAHKLTDYGVPDDVAMKMLTGTLSMTVDAGDQHVTLMAEVAISDTVTARFEIDIASNALTVRGNLKVGDLDFEVDFRRDTDRLVMAAVFTAEKGLEISLQDLAELAGKGAGTTLPKVGGAIKITVKDVLLGVVADRAPGGRGARALLAADVDGGVDLSGLGDLPVIGNLLPADSSLKLALTPVLAQKSPPNFDADDVKALNRLRGQKGPELPSAVSGPSLAVSIKLPGVRRPFDMDVELGAVDTGDKVEVKTTTTEAKKGPVKWVGVHKSIGPISLERLGLGIDNTDTADPKIRVLMDSTLGFGGLKLSLIGLGGNYGLKSQKVGFALDGMGLDLDREPLSIGGTFANIDGDYVGKAHLSLKQIALAASGGFTMIEGAPSMFIYGVLNVPIGGPPFFFVQGLAAGFGINRDLIAPDLRKVHEFPFVADAMALSKTGRSKGNPDDFKAGLQALHDYIRPQAGQYFVAAGIKFTSFKLLDSFVLAIPGFGREVKIDVLGMSTFQNPPIVPKGLPALARIELELKAAIRPAKGSILVEAALGPKSYVYSSLVKLHGGFAFASWFAGPHAGDFVISAGGYHPKFRRPRHYPPVRRIGLTFKVPNFDVSIKGQAYFALTPAMMMAGGSLEASAHFGKVSASFKMTLDFMVIWEPSHYDASLKISIHAAWWIFSTTAHAELHVWGPKFAGYARVHWSVISFDVRFGAGKAGAAAISWKKFQQSFLPHYTKDEAKTLHGVSAGDPKIKPLMTIAAGSLGTFQSGGTVHLVNPKDLRLLIDSNLPIQDIAGDTVPSTVKPGAMPGCPPIGVEKIEHATLKISVDKDKDAFAASVGSKQFPAAMWAQIVKTAAQKQIEAMLHNYGMPAPGHKPTLNGARTIEAYGTVEITLAQPADRGGKATTKRSGMYHPHTFNQPIQKAGDLQFKAGGGQVRDALMPGAGSAPAKRRAAVLDSLGLGSAGPRMDLTPDLRGNPAIVATGSS